MFHLLKNSLHAIASSEKGEIFITIEPYDTARNDLQKNKYKRLVFKDTAAGIASDKIGHIFDRFYTDKIHGTGIGLAFCRSALYAFGGEISCDSKLAEHVTFSISFPVAMPNKRVTDAREVTS